MRKLFVVILGCVLLGHLSNTVFFAPIYKNGSAEAEVVCRKYWMRTFGTSFEYGGLWLVTGKAYAWRGYLPN